MKFLQHIPSFIDDRGVTRQTSFEFDNKEELLNILEELGYGKREDFLGYEITPDGYLMDVSNEGKYWWVCGRVVGDLRELELPKWRAR